MNAPCSCCEGTEVLTPAAIVNRPGLTALAYRIGTHATFLETMKVRLSAAAFPEIENLNTRASDDPAIAWLDAWALVADVLTFYQERIANEGYLRTATERRSILELARLVGYTLRPGVAASVYLAYTLEENQQVEIPEGAQAQSVPGPGELPETFETSDKVETRAEWNMLPVRLTRPIDLGAAVGGAAPLFFKGTDTDLEPNDLLLVDGGGVETLLRVVEVTPDQANGRTRVTYQLWTAEPASLKEVASLASAPVAGNISHVREKLDTLRRADTFGVNTSSQTAQRLLNNLGELDNDVNAASSNTELRAVVDSALVELREEHRLATLGNFVKLLPWISAIVTELESISDSLKPASTSLATTPGATAIKAPLEDISKVIGDLEKPVSKPPPNSEQLKRSISSSFTGTSDALPKMLVTMRPALRDQLYTAWRNLPVTKSSPAQVFALRTQALVFGHNAPLKQITDPTTGRVTRTEEWTLFRTEGPAITEEITIDNILGVIGNGDQHIEMQSTVTITGSGAAVTGMNRDIFQDQPKTFEITVGTETVKVTLAGPTPAVFPETLTFEFTQRRFSIVATQQSSFWILESSVEVPAATTIRDLKATSNTHPRLTLTLSLESRRRENPTEEPKKVSLDASHKEILPGSWAVIEKPLKEGQPDILITKVNRVREASRADYGITGSGTQLELRDPWIDLNTDNFALIRGTTVFAESELLELAEAPIDPLVEAVCQDRIELNGLFDGLESGRWLIVSGERADITHGENANSVREILPGVKSSELVMLGGVEQGYDENLPGDKTHTTLILSDGLAYCYKRDTVKVYGNVVEATHGETRNEVLGSGDGSKAFQQFELRQSPVTYVAAPTTSGVENTLQVRVNDVRWHETESLDALQANDRKFITRTDDKDQTKVIFGNGVHAARLPSGVENVKAVYRTGIGRPGNVKADQITTPLTRPLGVQKVINPLRASGGADREGRDAARRNAPLAVMALDRLLSTKDYEDFARTFAGIGKASAARVSDGQQQFVHLTIAGAGDIPIDETSSLFRNLVRSLRRFGDPFQALQVHTRELMLLVISAKVQVLPDHLWESVAPKIRAALLDTFGFDRRELGQSVFLSEVISVIQNVPGVAYADLDVFDSVSETEILSPQDLATKVNDLVAQATQPNSKPKQVIPVRKAVPKSQGKCGGVTRTGICPAQIAFLSADVPDTLILTELKA